MASIVIAGDTSGSVTISAPAIAGTPTLTLPTTSGTLVVTGGAQTVQFAAGSAASPSITFTGDTNTGIFSPTADTVGFTTGGSERMRITSNGTVIVAATSSSFDTVYSALQISSTGALANYAPSGDFNMTSGLYYASGEWKYTTTGLKGSRFQVANQGIQAIAGTNASPTAGGSVTQSTILYLTYNNTLALQDATQSAGTGIAFPATQNASSNANTLDDYEEGTWTPTIVTGITSPTYSNQSGNYTKIGNVVTFTFRIAVSGGTANGTILSFSLPFTGINNGYLTGSAVWGYVSGGVIGSNTTNLPTLYLSSNEARIFCYKTTPDQFAGTDLVAVNNDIYIGGSYLTTN